MIRELFQIYESLAESNLCNYLLACPRFCATRPILCRIERSYKEKMNSRRWNISK